MGFVNDYSNLTGQCTLSGGCIGDQLDTQFNAGRAIVRGVEAGGALEFRVRPGVSAALSGNYTLSDARFGSSFVSGCPQFGAVQTGDFLPYVPLHQGSARASVDHDRLSVSLGSTARSGMLDAADTWPPDDLDVPALILVDAATSWRFTDRLSMYGTVTNLGNSTRIESWRPFGARPTAPRQVMLGIKMQARPDAAGG